MINILLHLTLISSLINRQPSSESPASGAGTMGQQTVYEAVCGKTGGFDAVVFTLAEYIIPACTFAAAAVFCIAGDNCANVSDYSQAWWTFPMEDR